MPIECLIYTSKASNIFKHENLHDIIATSVSYNKEFAITGALYYKEYAFMQYIEGSAFDVNTLFKKLLKDKLHNQLQLRHYGSTPDRHFSDWSLGQVSQDIIQVMGNDSFKGIPLNEITPDQALAFFQKVCKHKWSLLQI